MNEPSDLERFRAALEHEWEIAERLDDPVPEKEKVFGLVLLEMKFLADLPTAMAVANLAADWVESKNSFSMDAAIIICRDADITPPPSVRREIAKAAEQRFNDGGLPKNTSKKV